MKNNVAVLIGNLWPHLSRKYRRLYIALLGLMILSSVLELLSIGSVVPLITVLQEEGSLLKFKSFFPGWVEIDRVAFVIFVATIFCMMIIISNLFRMLNLWIGSSITYTLGAEISSIMFQNVIEQSYEFHTKINTSELITAIGSKASMLINSLQMVLTIISTLILTGVLMLGLLIYQPVITILVFIVIASFYILVTSLSKQAVIKNGEIVSEYTTYAMKLLQESFSSIRDIIIDNSQAKYSKMYHACEAKLRAAQLRNHYYATLPKYIIESIGIITLVVVAAYMSTAKDGFGSGIGVVALLGLAAQRLLPLLQNTYHAYINLRGWDASIKDVLKFLDLPRINNLTEVKSISFEEKLEINNVSFTYDETNNNILQNASLIIKKGSVVGFVGVTGAGKSTALDIIMSLLTPTSGQILVDGTQITSSNKMGWRRLVAHVPQNINLIDASIIDNITLSSPSNEVNSDRFKKVIQVCQLTDFIQSLSLKEATIIGERGVRLSGGQRQRIGIARALYKSTAFLIFDEATSSLDIETEEKLIRAIHDYLPDTTILMVAHRIASLRYCDVIYRLVSGKFEKIDNKL